MMKSHATIVVKAALFIVVVTLMAPMSAARAAHGYSIQPIAAFGRRYGSRGYRRPRQPQQRRGMTLEEYQSHFLDDENWMTDKKIRIWDTRIHSRRPNQYSWTTKLVLGNIAMFLLQSAKPQVTNWGVKISEKILRGEDLYRLLSPVFLHGNIVHLFSNMYSLNNVGPMTEQVFGSGRFLATFLVSGAAGNLLSAIQSPNQALGASGAVFGIMASLYVFLNRNGWLLGAQGEAYSSAITQTLLINLVFGAVSPMVDNWGHLGGAIGGAAMAYYFGPRLFIAEMPEGAGRVIVDKPIYRLPVSIESIPKNISNTISRIVRRMQVWRYKSDLGGKPWQSKQLRQSDYQRRFRNGPRRSVKPKFDDDDF